MSDGADGIGAAGTAEAPQGSAGGAEMGAGAAPEWMATLPDELKGDATLARYKDVAELAKGHVEAHKVAKSKLTVPGADAPPEAWNAVFDQLGRPESADKYEIPLPAGQEGSPIADAFKPLAHQLGLLPRQATALGEFFNSQIDGIQSAHYAKGEEEISALKSEMGADYEPKKAAAVAAYKAMGLDAAFADELESKVGSAALIKGFMQIAERIGEHGRVDGDGDLGLSASDANAAEQLKTKFADKSWREKYNAGDVETVAEEQRLRLAATKQASR